MVDLTSLHPHCTTLTQALDAAARLALQADANEHVFHAKGDRDFALEVDLAVEAAVKGILQQGDAGIPVLGEELAWAGNADTRRFWVVDPVDGTINYARDLPLFGTCIALIENGRPVLAGIDFPRLGERYLAAMGAGAWCNGRRLQVAGTDALDQALVGCGDFAVGDGAAAKNRVRLATLQHFGQHALRVRMLGSAAVQLAWLAAGRLDVSLILSNKPWDVQAGVLIAREAGAEVYDVDGREHDTGSRYTLASVDGLKQFVLSAFTAITAGLADTSV